MNFKNKILAGLLVLQLLLIMIVFWENGELPVEENMLVTGLAFDQVDRFLITDDEGRILAIRKVDDGWQVEIEKDTFYQADNEKVQEMIEKLLALKSSRLVTRTRGSHERLKVSDKAFSRSLRLSGNDTDPAILYLGTAPNYKSIHVRTAGDDNVYLVKDLSAWEVQAEASSWWQSSYIDVDPESLLEVKMQNEHGEFMLARTDTQRDWAIEGSDQALDKEKLAGFLDDASGLSVTDLVSPSTPKPEGEPQAILSLKSGNEKIELKIWNRQDENSDYPVKSSGNTFYAMAGKYAIDDLFEISIENLVEPVPLTISK